MGVPRVPVRYTLVGNGWCTSANKRHPSYAHWANAPVRADNSAALCEKLCADDDDCIGYLTEDGKKCQVMPGRGEDGKPIADIDAVDSEPRNFCWRKSVGG